MNTSTVHIQGYIQQTLKANHLYKLAQRYTGLLGTAYEAQAKFCDCVAVAHLELLSHPDRLVATKEYERAYRIGLYWTQVTL